MGWLKKAIDSGNIPNRTGINPLLYNYCEWGNAVDRDLGFEDLWRKNIFANSEYWDNHKESMLCKINDMPNHEGECMIFVGASPILRKSVKYLKNLPPKFKIVAVNSSLKYLVDHGIIPDYCVMVDGAEGRWTAEWDTVLDKCKDVVGLFGVAACPSAVQKWPGKYIVIPYKYDDKAITKLIRKKYGKDSPMGGGNSFNCAFSVFLQFTQSTIFLFVANELSFKDSYYVNKGEAKSDGKPYIFAHNIHGKEVKTLFNLYEYKVWLENMIQAFVGKVYCCDTSEGILGVESDGSLMPMLDHKSLPEALKDIGDAFAIEELPLNEQNKIWYSGIFDTGAYLPMLGKQYSEEMVANLNKDPEMRASVNKVLDFGCGLGDSVKVFADSGFDSYGVDIAENYKQWAARGVTDKCQTYDGDTIPFDDNTFGLVNCTEVMEHLPPEKSQPILEEIYRVGKKYFVFTIALNEEMAPLYGYIYLHINLKTPDEWLKIFDDIGYKVIVCNAQQYHEDNGTPIRTLYVFAQKGDVEADDFRAQVSWVPSREAIA